MRSVQGPRRVRAAWSRRALRHDGEPRKLPLAASERAAGLDGIDVLLSGRRPARPGAASSVCVGTTRAASQPMTPEGRPLPGALEEPGLPDSQPRVILDSRWTPGLPTQSNSRTPDPE